MPKSHQNEYWADSHCPLILIILCVLTEPLVKAWNGIKRAGGVTAILALCVVAASCEKAVPQSHSEGPSPAIVQRELNPPPTAKKWTMPTAEGARAHETVDLTESESDAIREATRIAYELAQEEERVGKFERAAYEHLLALTLKVQESHHLPSCPPPIDPRPWQKYECWTVDDDFRFFFRSGR